MVCFCTVHALYTNSRRNNTHLIPPHRTLLEDTITILDGKSSALFTLYVLLEGSEFEHVCGCGKGIVLSSAVSHLRLHVWNVHVETFTVM